MKTVVYYFTRTGTSEKLAKKLARSKKVKAYPIEDRKDWKGLMGFIKGGFYATMKKSLPAVYRAPGTDEEIILVMPLWAGTYPPAVRTFIDKVTRARITLVVSSRGSKLTDRADFIKVVDAIGPDAKVTL